MLELSQLLIMQILLFIFGVEILLEVIVQLQNPFLKIIMQMDFQEQEQKLLELHELEHLKLELV